ncbi:MAG: PilT/PilU family type 4a pilus ATPase [Planctomycetota bacterium]
MTWNLEKILKAARRLKASDVHLITNMAPLLRIGGEIRPVEGEPLDAEQLQSITNSILNEKHREQLDRDWQLCLSRHLPDLGRFRISIYYHSGVPEMAIRLCETEVRTREDLHLPPIVEELTRLPNGLILVTGQTGMGKTTTLSFMVDCINRTRRSKIVMIEDPIEFVHQNQRSIVVQQEVMTDVKSYSDALLHVLRQDPDVIVIGEMRSLETIETALTAAETGHLVLATLHTPDSVQTIQRIFSVFPGEQQNSIVTQIANCLQAIICQRLLPRADGQGQVLASEICVVNHAIRNHIRERETQQIYSVIQTGRKHQMQTMDSALLELYQRGEITYDMAVSNAREPAYIRNVEAKSSS